jgi:K+-transporting ATPase KdpF subunit
LVGTHVVEEQSHDGSNIHYRDLRILCSRAHLHLGVYPPMTPWELVMGVVMVLSLTVYLIYAMLRPEKF